MPLRTISFYSYKGGVGRTLVVANVARRLAQLGQTVVAMDFDLEAPGLHYKLGLWADDEKTPIRCGLVDYLYAFVVDGRPPEDVKQFTVALPRQTSSMGAIHLLPAGAAPSPEYWRKLSQINWHDLFYGGEARGVALFLELKAQIEEQLRPDFLLIDARTGITEIGGVATTILPEKVVCLLLNNRENLEGARAVLRSFRRAPRFPEAPPIDIVPVLSRLPVQDPERERESVERVTRFLNSPPKEPEEALDVPEVLILHSDPELQLDERLYVDDGKKPEESELLRDYLKLFRHLVPLDVIAPHVDTLVQQAKRALFEDPDAAQRELENLAEYLGYPDLYRELIKLYRVRNVGGKMILDAARKLWDSLDGVPDPLVWEVVKNHLKASQKPSEAVSWDFAEAAWRAAGANDVDVGLSLAAYYSQQGKHGEATDLLMDLVRTVGPEAKAVIECLKALQRAGRWDEATPIIELSREMLVSNDAFLHVWAHGSSGQIDRAPNNELLEQANLLRLAKIDLSLAYGMLVDVGRKDEAKKLMEESLKKSLRFGGAEALAEVGALFIADGRRKEFEEAVRERLGEAVTEEVMHNLDYKNRLLRRIR